MLAACATLSQAKRDVEQEVDHYTEKANAATEAAHALPAWVIIIGAVALFFLGFGLIWKLIPGFIKFIALIVLAVAIAGGAYGLWQIPVVDKAIDTVDNYIEQRDE